MTTSRFRQLSLIVIASAVVLMSTAHSSGQNTLTPQVTISQADFLERARALTEQARQTAQPIPDGEIKILQAVVIAVSGRAQWRPSADSPWKSAEVDDLLAPDARIRTGGRSSLALRIGLDTTLLVGARSRVALPQIVQAGAELKTTLGLDRGRLDFKVDRIGLASDFRVVTPSMTLAVRGTGGALRYGGLRGTEVVGAQYNLLNAVELKYFLSKYIFFLSGKGRSDDRFQNPVFLALFDTIGPPSMFTRVLGEDQLIHALETSFIVDRSLQSGRRVKNSEASLDRTKNDLGNTVDGNPNTAMLINALCLSATATNIYFDDFYTPALLQSFGSSTNLGDLATTEQTVTSICTDFNSGELTSDLAFAQILTEISNYCQPYELIAVGGHDTCLNDFLVSLQNFAAPAK